MTDPAPNPFWQFSLALYQRPGIAAICIDLQDRCGVDINLLLYALWHGFAFAVPIAGSAWLQLHATVAPWQRSVIAPLRAVRRHLKEPSLLASPAATEDLRHQLKHLELGAERLEQDALFHLNAGRQPASPGLLPAAGRAAACANLQVVVAGTTPVDATARSILLEQGALVWQLGSFV